MTIEWRRLPYAPPVDSAFEIARYVTYVTAARPALSLLVGAVSSSGQQASLMPADPIAFLVLLAGLQLKHVLFDFVFQSDWQIRNKGRYGHPGGLAHAGLHAIGTLTVCMIGAAFGLFAVAIALALAVADALIHYHVDWTKAQISRRMNLTADDHGFWIAFGADQAIHQATYLGFIAFLLI